MKTAHLILGNQLFEHVPEIDSSDNVIMIEAYDLCARRRYHKHKLMLILMAMRDFRDKLRAKGLNVIYIELSAKSNSSNSTFSELLKRTIASDNIEHLSFMEPSEEPTLKNLLNICNAMGITYKAVEDKAFITPKTIFDEWYLAQKNPLMESFYRMQRKRTSILMQKDKPLGGVWNYDDQNRQPLPKKDVNIPAIGMFEKSTNFEDVQKVVDALFIKNPGNSGDFWLPTSHKNARFWLVDFVENRLPFFGTYEDAMRTNEPFLYHSVLSPLINCGLLEPTEVIEAALFAHQASDIGLYNIEGFIRQIIGWREYMYGVYRNMPELKGANFFGFTKKLEDWWYVCENVPEDLPVPVIEALKNTHKYGYNHHIERLMVLGNWFLLNEYDPRSVYEWFSAMYVDAYDWVMLPNVMGMSQYADGGSVATKPYISGGNYLQKMGNWWPSLEDARKSDFNALYWEFLYNNKDKLKNNPRMSIALSQAVKISEKTKFS